MNCQLIQDALRRGRRRLVIAAATVDSAQALSVMKGQQPDVAVISMRLLSGPVDGLELLRNIHAMASPTRVIMLLESRERELVVDAFRFGARGVVFRDEPLRILAKCIHAVHAGQIWLDSLHLEYLIEALRKAMPPAKYDSSALARLTGREQEIVLGIAEGLSNRDVAARLSLSEHTVRNYLQHVFDKLGVSTRTELALYWLRRAS
jgi:DNA-binding NarL/FixJ family response regulator